MEVLAAGASIAGLLSLSGQCIAGARNLRNLYQDVALASKTADSFLRDINTLLSTLHDAEDLLGRMAAGSALTGLDVQTTTLKLHLEDCQRDVTAWLAEARSLRPSSGKGGKAWFRKFIVAANKNSISNVRTEMDRRRREIATSLSVIGR